MKKNSILLAVSIAIVFGIAITACTKKGEEIKNPYDNNPKNNTTDTSKAPSPTSLAGLHKNLFKPTCANSGCHDGTFEPDFRTAESSYNTMINIAPIKPDLAGTFNYRVVPGNAAASMLVYRLTENLGGNSGIMPLVVNPDNPYPTQKVGLIQNLKDWINAGAPDLNGKTTQPVDFPPQIMGVQAVTSGTNTLVRGGKYEPILTSANTSFQLWFSLTDDKLSQDQLKVMTINFSTDPDTFNPANEKPLVKGSKTLPGLYGGNITYGWYYDYNTVGLKTDDVLWFRITTSDGTNTSYKLPNRNSMFFLKKYFAFKIY